MTRKYQKLEDKINGIVPCVGMGATIHIDKYVVPCTIIEVTTTDRRAPMVGVQVDRTGKREFFRDDTGAVLLFTYRADGRWIQYGYGRVTGAVLELAVRRSKSHADADTGYADAVGCGGLTDAVKSCGADAVKGAESTTERLRERMRTNLKK